MGKKVIIIGAGITGLTAGMELVKKNYDVVIIEKESKPGGLAQSKKFSDAIFDYGPHAFQTKDIDILLKVQEILKGKLIKIPAFIPGILNEYVN